MLPRGELPAAQRLLRAVLRPGPEGRRRPARGRLDAAARAGARRRRRLGDPRRGVGTAVRLASHAGDELVERQAVRPRAPLLGRAATPGRAAAAGSRSSSTYAACSSPSRSAAASGSLQAVRARDDALVPGREHHVLRRAPDVEAAATDDRDDERRAAARSPARRRRPRSVRRASSLSTTTKRRACRFAELPARRPASRIRSTTSSGTGRSA